MVTSFVNAKGGVGKTTISVHYAVWLAERGAKVAFIDADKQQLSSRWLQQADRGVDLWTIEHEQEMLDRIAMVRGRWDHLIIDGPAGDTGLTRVILLRSDLACLPCGPSDLDLAGTRQEIRIIHDVQEIRGGPPQAWFVPNRVNPDQVLTRELLAVGDQVGIPFTDHYLRLRFPYADAPGQGSVVWRMGAIRRHAAEEVRSLCEEIYAKEIDAGR